MGAGLSKAAHAPYRKASGGQNDNANR